jgi:hypothetical protein
VVVVVPVSKESQKNRTKQKRVQESTGGAVTVDKMVDRKWTTPWGS